jgi:PAS domain S-box-containing protein
VEWFGVAAESIIGVHVSKVVGPKTYADIEPYLARALGGHGVTFERWFRLPTLGARYLHTVYVPHRAAAGEVSGLYAVTSDLTAHKRTEEAAQFMADCGQLLIASMDVESTSRGIVHLAVPRVADAAVLFRAEGDSLRADAVAHADGAVEAQLRQYLNQIRLPISAQNNIGVAARTGLPIAVAELAPDDLDRAAADESQRTMLRMLQLRSALHVPVVVRNKIWAVYSFGTSIVSGRQFTDEHRQLAEEIATRVRLAVENALLFREAQQEIEERRRAERIARQVEERFRLLVEGVRDYAITTLDASGQVESWNEGAQRMLGYSASEVLGQAIDVVYCPEDREAGLPARDLAVAGERGAASDERWFLCKDASRVWASSHVVALRDDGVLRGYAVILRDLTDRKRMEEELERRVQLRTTELNEAVHELEAFSYSVSHDLRAPLRTIRGFTELTLEEADGRLNEQEQGYLDRVRRASVRLERLIADLLAYTRVSKTKVELRPVDLHSLVSDIQREHPEFQPPHAEIVIESTLLPAIGNEAYLTQCITNLLGNAVKFVPPGRHPRVHVWSERHGDRVLLFVRDNGIGIAPERLKKAFEMFERLHTTGSYEGTGVGLAIVRRAVQRMEGTVGVESKEGEGSTFWIDLRAAGGTG